MKKSAILASLALVASGGASAAAITLTVGTAVAVCSGSTAVKNDANGGPGAPVTDSTSFIKTGFSVQCSSNTHVTANNASATSFLIGSGSAKGNQSFKGSSNGGAVVLHTTCATSGCTSTDATAATTAASSM